MDFFLCVSSACQATRSLWSVVSVAIALNARALELASSGRIPKPSRIGPRKVVFQLPTHGSLMVFGSWMMRDGNPHEIPNVCWANPMKSSQPGASRHVPAHPGTSCHGASPPPPLRPSWVPWPRGSPGPPHRFPRPRRHSMELQGANKELWRLS